DHVLAELGAERLRHGPHPSSVDTHRRRSDVTYPCSRPDHGGAFPASRLSGAKRNSVSRSASPTCVLDPQWIPRTGSCTATQERRVAAWLESPEAQGRARRSMSA